MSSSKQPKPNALRSRISAPPGSKGSTRPAKRIVSAGGVKKAAAKPATTRAANPLKNNALFQAIKGIPRTSPTASAQPYQPKPGQELRDRIAGRTPAKVAPPPPAKSQAPAKPSNPLANRFGQPPVPKHKLGTHSAPTAPSYTSSSSSSSSSSRGGNGSGSGSGNPSDSTSDNRRSTYDTSSASSSWGDGKYHQSGGGYDRHGNYDKNSKYDKFGRSQEKYDRRDRDRYERARIERREQTAGDLRGSKDKLGDGSSQSNGSSSYRNGNGSRDRHSYSDQSSRTQAQSYQESRERYAEDRVRYNARHQQQAAEEAAAAAAAAAAPPPTVYTIPDDPVVSRPAVQMPASSGSMKPASEATTLSANGIPSYSIKHLAMPPIVQISNLDRGTTRDDLYKFFVELGDIRDCRVLTLGNQGAMGEITFEDPDNARTAFAKFNGALADGRRLVVNIVKYNSIADQKPVEVNNNVHQWPGAGNLRSDGYLKK